MKNENNEDLMPNNPEWATGAFGGIVYGTLSNIVKDARKSKKEIKSVYGDTYKKRIIVEYEEGSGKEYELRRISPEHLGPVSAYMEIAIENKGNVSEIGHLSPAQVLKIFEL